MPIRHSIGAPHCLHEPPHVVGNDPCRSRTERKECQMTW